MRTVIDQAEDLLLCGQQNVHHFVPPSISFHFLSGVTELLSQKLIKVGVTVHGTVVQSKLSCESEEDSFEGADQFDCNSNAPMQDIVPNTDCLNLDISTMICYVSSLTNGGSHRTFREAILSEEAESEKKKPVKPILDELFKGVTFILI